MPVWQGIPILLLEQESPFLLCGLQRCEKISLLTAVAMRARGVLDLFPHLLLMREEGKAVEGT